jgi:hypothetical protein
MRGRISIERDLLRDATLLNRTRKEALRGSDIAVFAQEEINRESGSVNGAISINPLASNFEVGFVDAPRQPDWTRVPLPALGKLWDIALHPAQAGRMRYVHIALGRHRHQITVAQLVRQVPSHAQDNEGAVKVTALA